MQTIAKVTIPEELRGTGKCRHVRNGDDVTGQVASVSLAQFEPNSGFYLLYVDDAGNELNDLFFETEVEAIDQLEFEFGNEVSNALKAVIM